MNKTREDLVLQDIAAMDVLLSHPEYFEKRAALYMKLYNELGKALRPAFSHDEIFTLVSHARFPLASEQLAVETETEVELPQSPQEPRED